MAEFKSPVVHVNAGGWGPTEDNVPEQFRDLPFAPFSKGDLGKGFRVADFTANGAAQQRFQNRFRGKDEAVNDMHPIILCKHILRKPKPHFIIGFYACYEVLNSLLILRINILGG